MERDTAKRDLPKLWLASSQSAARAAAHAAPNAPAPPRAPEPALDDTQLLEALRNGETSAAASLHDRVRPQVMRTVGRLLGYHDSDREDLAQLAMIELVTTLGRFRGDCSLDAWTSMVTARIVYKHIRRRKTERRIFEDVDLDDVVMRSSRNTGREALLRGLIARVRGHLDRMEPTRAWTFLLHDACGYDLREIAEITGVSVSAAQTRLTRGRRELHTLIAADPELASALEETEAFR